MSTFAKWCFGIALGPIALPFLLWPVFWLAGCERGSIDTLRCVRAEWFSSFATTVIYLPWFSFITIPGALVVGIVGSLFLQKKSTSIIERPTVEPSLFAKAISSSLGEFQSGSPISTSCPACGSRLEVKETKRQSTSGAVQFEVNCACGKSHGTFKLQSKGP